MQFWASLSKSELKTTNFCGVLMTSMLGSESYVHRHLWCFVLWLGSHMLSFPNFPNRAVRTVAALESTVLCFKN